MDLLYFGVEEDLGRGALGDEAARLEALAGTKLVVYSKRALPTVRTLAVQ
jgi:hypothetical protein